MVVGIPPDSWAATTLGDVCHKPQYGWTTKAVDKPSSMRLLRTTDISKGPIKWPSVPYCAESPPDKEKYKLKSGDIVISRAGSVGLSALIGSCPDSVFASYLIRFRVVERLNRRYVFWFLNSPGYWEQISQASAGIALQNVNAKKLATLELPLPPLPEQHRIVAEIEKHFTRLDASISALKRVQANLSRYRASVLKSACEGKLVPTEAELAQSEGRDYEPADRLLERILSERRAQWESQEKRRGKYKEPIAPDTSDLPELPEGWVWAVLGLMGEVRLGRQRSPKRATGPHMRPYLRAGNITWDGLDLSDIKEMDFSPREYETYRLRSGDILLAEASGSADEVGKPAVWAGEIDGCCFQNTLIRVRVCPDVVPYLHCHLLSDARSGALGRAARGVGIHHLGAQRAESWMVALPPLAEQRRIVAEVERRLSVIQRTEAAVEANLTRAERLRQSILKQAFSGKLVPQDPSDEPASVLLERIRAERDAAQAAAKSSRKPRRHRSKSNTAARPKVSEAAR